MAESLAETELLIVGQPDAERSEDEWLLLLLLLLAQRRDMARQSWRTYGPQQMVGLVDATAYATRRDRPARPPVWWFLLDDQRYGIGSLRLVTREGIDGAVDDYRQAVANQLQRTTRAVTDGTLALPQWQQAVRDLLTDYQLALAAVGRGGLSQLTEEDDRRIGASLAFQFTRLQVFAAELAGGRYADPEPVLHRAAHYVADASQQYEASRFHGHVVAGFTLARNVLDAQAESCIEGTPDVPGCVELTERGWMPIRSMVLPGRRRCGFNCRCRLEFRR